MKINSEAQLRQEIRFALQDLNIAHDRLISIIQRIPNTGEFEIQEEELIQAMQAINSAMRLLLPINK